MENATPQSKFHLMRTWYQTDADTQEPEYQGTFSETIPGTALTGSAQIINVDWNNPAKGWVQVTFLQAGPGHPSDNPYPWTNPEVKP
jgi:hypothetical protein